MDFVIIFPKPAAGGYFCIISSKIFSPAARHSVIMRFSLKLLKYLVSVFYYVIFGEPPAPPRHNPSYLAEPPPLDMT